MSVVDNDTISCDPDAYRDLVTIDIRLFQIIPYGHRVRFSSGMSQAEVPAVHERAKKVRVSCVS